MYDHWLDNKAHFSDVTVANVSESFTHKMAAKASWYRNYVTVTLCITATATKSPVIAGSPDSCCTSVNFTLRILPTEFKYTSINVSVVDLIGCFCLR